MEFDDDKIDLSELDDRRGQSGASGAGAFGGGGLSGGVGGGGLDAGGLGSIVAGGLAGKSLGSMGGIGLIIIVALLVLSQCQGASQSSSQLQGSGSTNQTVASGDPNNMATRCVTKEAIAKYDDCYILKSHNEINEVWTSYFATKGQQYRKPKLVYFTKSVRTGCGMAQSNAGPFYCPPDQSVYIDLDYMNTLFKQIGASGRYAQTYVIAHEVGHHLQTLLGTEAKVRKLQQQNPRQENALSVKMELQADCYAGVYGNRANKQGNQKITQAEFDQALQAAAAVGDDKIMASAGMRVNPDNFTHGSAADRQKWFNIGFKSGDISSCNTFA